MGAPGRARGPWFSLVAIGALAVALRAALWLQVRETAAFALPVLDSRFYLETAQALAAGGSLPPRPFFMSPGYTAFVALAASVAKDVQSLVVGLQIVLDAMSCVLIARLAWRRAGALAGATAGLLLALHGAQIVFATRVLDATLGSFLVVLLLLALDRLDRDARPRTLALVGLVVGAVATLRATALLFLPAALVLIAWRRRAEGLAPFARRAAALLLACALPIAPVTLRNLLVTGEPVLLTSSGGVNFLIGNHPESDGRFTTLNYVFREPGVPLGPGRFVDDPSGGDFELAARRFAEQETGRTLTARETSAFYAGIARRAIGADPLAWARLLVRKACLFLNAFEVPQVDNLYFLARLVPWLEPLAQSSRWLWPLALVGLVIGGRALPPLARAFFVTHALAIVLFFVTDRYRLWVTPIAALAAGAAVARLVQVARTGTTASKVGHGAALAGLALFCNLNPARFDPAGPDRAGADRGGWFAASSEYLDFRAQHNNLAARCLDRGDPQAALAECDAGLALEPGDPTLRFNLRRALEALAAQRYREGDFGAARSAAERWLAEFPRDAEAWNTAGAARLKVGDADGGLAAIRRAIELAPRDPKYRRNLAVGLVRSGRHAEAIPLLEQALAAQPGDLALLLDRAEAAIETGDAALARRITAQVLAQQPGLKRARELAARCR